jgi:hypothetical protein
MQANLPTNHQDLQALLLAAARPLAPMAEVGENAADGGRHVRFEVSEDLCNGRTRYRCSSANHVRNPWLSSSAHLTGLLVESASL